MRTNTKGNVILTSFDSGFVFASFFSVSLFGQFAFGFIHDVFSRFL